MDFRGTCPVFNKEATIDVNLIPCGDNDAPSRHIKGRIRSCDVKGNQDCPLSGKSGCPIYNNIRLA